MLFREYIKINKAKFIVMSCMIISFSLLSLPFPYISKILVDNILLNGNYKLILPIILLFVVLITVQTLLGRFNAINVANYFQKFINELRNRIFRSTIKSNFSTTNTTGQVETMIMSDVELLSNANQQIFNSAFSNISMLLGYTAILFLLNWKLAIISILFLPLYAVWVVKIGEKMKIYHKKNQEVKERLFGNINNTFSNILVIVIYDFYKEVISSFNNLVEDSGYLNKKTILYQNFVNLVTNLIVLAAQFIPLFVGVFFVKNGEITIGELIAFNSYSSQFFSPVTTLINIIPIKKTAEIYNDRIKQHINENINGDDHPIDFMENSIESDISLRISNYELFSNKTKILSIDDFEICKGEAIHLQGENGSGKTLFLKSISNIYKDYCGVVKIGDTIITSEVAINNISNIVIYVSNTQNFVLDNLYKELTINTNISDAELEDVLKSVYLFEKISDLPKGINSSSLEVMSNLSTGELQRLRIARALLRKPNILLLDEIFSNIDSSLTSKIYTNIRELHPHMSIVLVEHHMPNDINIDKNVNIQKGALLSNTNFFKKSFTFEKM